MGLVGMLDCFSYTVFDNGTLNTLFFQRGGYLNYCFPVRQMEWAESLSLFKREKKLISDQCVTLFILLIISEETFGIYHNICFYISSFGVCFNQMKVTVHYCKTNKPGPTLIIITSVF